MSRHIAEILLVLIAGYLGALTASLIVLLGSRFAAGESIATKHSHCVCSRPLSLYEVIPIVGYVLTRGRARCCGAKIPTRYLIEESLGALCGATFWLSTPLSVLSVLVGVGLFVYEYRRTSLVDTRHTPPTVKPSPEEQENRV